MIGDDTPHLRALARDGFSSPLKGRASRRHLLGSEQHVDRQTAE